MRLMMHLVFINPVNFQMPHKHTKTEWLKAYRLCYNNFTEY